MSNSQKQLLFKDFQASLVVFLIAMPLCLGIALASGVDPIKGLITGVVGAIAVSLLSGCPLQISGPSAGLAVMVFYVVEQFGAHSLVPLGIIVGLFQLITSYAKVAHFFQATPPALLKGMLSGIGVLILLSQIYVIFGLPVTSNGFNNLLGVPEIVADLVSGQMSTTQMQSALIAAMVVAIMIFWSFGRSLFFELIPGPLVSIVSAGLVVYLGGWTMRMVQLPDDLFGAAFNINYKEAFAGINMRFLGYSLGFAFVASAETLLCVSAIDKMAKTTSSYNKTIMAQGVGNLVTGLLGAIPVVGVISRSAANIEFGARSRLASVLMGLWIMGVLFLPDLLELIPVPALAGLLIFIGIKLLGARDLLTYFRADKKISAIYFTTFLLTFLVDLLTGVVAGFAVSIIILVLDVLKYDLVVEGDGDDKVLKFKGKLSFLDLPVLSKTLQKQNLEDASNLEICLQEVEYLDPAISEHLDELKDKLEAQGKTLKIRYSQVNIH